MTPESIAFALREKPAFFGVTACHDFFCMTEQLCHFRFCMLERIQESPARLLAWLVKRSPRDEGNDWIDNCNNIYVKPLSDDELRVCLSKEIATLKNHDHASQPWSFPFAIDDIVFADEIFSISGIDPYSCGPTYITCWWNLQKFYYLETHLES